MNAIRHWGRRRRQPAGEGGISGTISALCVPLRRGRLLLIATQPSAVSPTALSRSASKIIERNSAAPSDAGRKSRAKKLVANGSVLQAPNPIGKSA
jgi:hypothetical protein